VERTIENSPPIHRWDQVAVLAQVCETDGRHSAVRLSGLQIHVSIAIPALKRWATFSRPLKRTRTRVLQSNR